MGWFVVGAIFALIGVIALAIAGYFGRVAVRREAAGEYKQNIAEARGAKRISSLVGLIAVGLGVLFAAFSMIFFQSVGEAKVIINADGTISGQKLEAGIGFKAPWQDTVDFNTFSQELLYAGSSDGVTPSYSKGTVNGAEVTVAVGGVSGGSTQGFMDISIVYSIDPEKVQDIYKEFRSQERFTQLVIEKTILSEIRRIPAAFTATEFRGAKMTEATELMTEAITKKLGSKGVTNVLVNVQDVRYPENVEAAISAIETANQDIQKAEAEQRKKTVEAETKRIEAQGTADANKILEASLTPEILQQKLIEAYGEGTVFVVPEGSTPLVTTGK